MYQTNASRLQFALRFAQLDLPTLREGDQLNVRDDLFNFLVADKDGILMPAHGGIMTMPKPPHPRDYTLEELQALQAEVHTLLFAIAAQGDMTFPGTKRIVLQSVEYATLSHRVRRTPDAGMHLLAIGSTRDMVMLTLLWLLTHESPDRIRKCPECSTMFYRAGRQHYCSRPCLNRVAGRHWREKEENKEKNRDKAHAAYKKRVAAGGPAVQRRPRKSPAGQMDALSIPGDLSHEAHDF